MRFRPALIVSLAIAALALLGTAGTVLAFPVVGAATCPLCYGLDRFGDDRFIERTASPQLRGHVGDVVGQASADTQPRVLVCVSDDCYRRIGGIGSRGTAWFDVALQLSPRGIDPVIAAHELSHMELRHRLGRLRFLMGAIPAWFDEGVAVVVSDDRRYLAPANAPEPCLIRSDEELPTGRFDWIREVGRFDTKQLYAKAACRVAEWMAAKGGAAAVTRLVGQVSSGTPFAEAYAATIGVRVTPMRTSRPGESRNPLFSR